MFKQAYIKTMGHEGGYSNHPSDRGGETWKGIARNFHPLWKGWQIIDQYVDKNMLRYNNLLEFHVKEFYKILYWDKVNLTKISGKLPDTSLELFDIAVNMGTTRAGQFLQRALNILNRDEKIWNDLTVDAKIGNMTLAVIDKYIENNNEDYILKLIVLLKAKHYIDIVEKNETQEAFIRGWLNRIQI